MITKIRAFTLVELLTVISIIAVLVAITFPVISRARESGRATACLSNLHQLGTAIALYTSDYDSLYPYGLDGLFKHISLENIFDEPYLTMAKSMPDVKDVLAPYVRSTAVYRCPSEHLMPGDVASDYATLGSDYSYCSFPAMLRENDTYYISPATGYLMADLIFWHAGSYWGDGRLNELFADYHVKNVTWEYYLATIPKRPGEL